MRYFPHATNDQDFNQSVKRPQLTSEKKTLLRPKAKLSLSEL